MKRAPLLQLTPATALVALVLAIALSHAGARPDGVQLAGGEFVALATIVIGALAKLFGGLFGGISGQTKNALLAIRDGMTTLGNKIADIATTAGSWFKSIFGSTSKLWTRVLKPIVKRLETWILWLQKHLSSWFAPLVKWIKLLRADVLKFYKKFLRPILDTIDFVRKTLRLLAILGVPGAKKAEQKLAELESRLEGPFLLVVKKLNEALDWINRIVTINGFLQRFILLRSMIEYKRDVAAFIVKAGYKKASVTQQIAYAMPVETLTPQQQGQSLVRALERDGGKLDLKATEWGQDLVRLMRR